MFVPKSFRVARPATSGRGPTRVGSRYQMLGILGSRAELRQGGTLWSFPPNSARDWGIQGNLRSAPPTVADRPWGSHASGATVVLGSQRTLQTGRRTSRFGFRRLGASQVEQNSASGCAEKTLWGVAPPTPGPLEIPRFRPSRRPKIFRRFFLRARRSRVERATFAHPRTRPTAYRNRSTADLHDHPASHVLPPRASQAPARRPHSTSRSMIVQLLKPWLCT